MHISRRLGRGGRVLFAAFGLALVVSGCAGTSTAARPEPPLLRTAATTYLSGDYQMAVTLYTDYLGTATDSSHMAEGYLGRANAYAKLGKYVLAEADYRNAISNATDKVVKAEGTMGLANTLAAREQFEAAEKLYRKVLSSYGGYIARDDATYRLGLMLARQAKWDDAAVYLGQVPVKWPASEYARYAKAKLAAVVSRSFTVQVGAYANKDLARQVMTALASKGFPARIESIDTEAVALDAVRSGRLMTWESVSDHAKKLKAAGFSTYILP